MSIGNFVSPVCACHLNPVVGLLAGVCRSRSSADVKEKLATALLGVMDHPVYGEQFRKYNISGFRCISPELYDRAHEVMELAKELKMCPARY